MENILGYALFGGFIWFLISFILLFLFLVYAEHEENGVIATSAFIVFIILNHFWGNFPLMKYLLRLDLLAAYLVLGFIYSLIRTYFIDFFFFPLFNLFPIDLLIFSN